MTKGKMKKLFLCLALTSALVLTSQPASANNGWTEFFLPGEYPEEIQRSSGDWDLLPVAGEEDVNEASMTFAVTQSKEGDSLLALYWAFGNCYFEVRFPGNNGMRSVREFMVDGKKYDTAKLSAAELITVLRRGRTLVITENLPVESQEYSLRGTHRILSEVAAIADRLELKTF